MTAPGSGANILVIDDDAQRRDTYGAMLGDLGAGVEAVASGEGARRLGAQPYAVVVFHLDGAQAAPVRDAASIVRELEGIAGAPVILVSDAGPDFAALGQAGLGTFDHVPASAAPDVLLNKVKLFLELTRLRAAADEQAHAAAELKSLVSEQIHRGKNLLATMQSIALRTISEGRDLKEARSALVGRLKALAKAYDLLSTSSPKGVLLGEIVELELGEVANRVSATGPAVRLSGSFAQTFALAIHELTTNAIRHGALCAEGGSVAVGWTLFETGSDRYLEVGWTERGGPPAKGQPRHGFGLTLISSLAASAGDSNYSFDGEGFACRLRLPSEIIASA